MGSNNQPNQGRLYTNKIHEEVVKWVREGNSRADAFRLVGIKADLGYEWCYHARQQPDRYPEYVQLLADIEEAEAEVRAEMAAIVVNAAKSDPKHWTAAMTYLERRDPENWGRRDTTVVEAGAKPLIQLNQIVLADEEARALSRDLLRRVSAGSTPLELEAGHVDEEAS